MDPICRACLEKVKDSKFIAITDDSESLQIRTKLSSVIPEMIIDRVINPILCSSCVDFLQSAYDFKSRCLLTEERIQKYLQSMPLESKSFNLEEIYNNMQQSNMLSLTNSLNCPIEHVAENASLDEALQNEVAIIDIKKETPHHVENDQVQFENIIIKKEYFGSSDHELDVENKKLDENFTFNSDSNTKECFVKLEKLPDESVDSNNMSNYRSNRKKHYKNRFCCKFCDYKSAKKYNFESHMKIHFKKSLICNVCNKRFRYKPHFKKHMLTHTVEKPFSCTKCPFKTTYKSNLTVHMKSHSVNYFSCNICSYRTLSKQYLKCHMRIHTGEKPFACKLCKFQTSQKQRLQEHIRTHTGEKPLSCNLCFARFAHRANLRRHTRLHEKQVNLTCKVCEYKCKSELLLKAHLMHHIAKKNMSCPKCKYTTTNPTSYEAHLKLGLHLTFVTE